MLAHSLFYSRFSLWRKRWSRNESWSCHFVSYNIYGAILENLKSPDLHSQICLQNRCYRHYWSCNKRKPLWSYITYHWKLQFDKLKQKGVLGDSFIFRFSISLSLLSRSHKLSTSRWFVERKKKERNLEFKNKTGFKGNESQPFSEKQWHSIAALSSR